jgi:DNA-binding NarL/FixJ family response regulator
MSGTRAGIAATLALPASPDRERALAEPGHDLQLARLAARLARPKERRAAPRRRPCKQRKLTKREHEALGFIIKTGATSKEVAREMGLSPGTVNLMRRRIIKALGARNMVDAVLIATGADRTIRHDTARGVAP